MQNAVKRPQINAESSLARRRQERHERHERRASSPTAPPPAAMRLPMEPLPRHRREHRREGARGDARGCSARLAGEARRPNRGGPSCPTERTNRRTKSLGPTWSSQDPLKNGAHRSRTQQKVTNSCKTEQNDRNRCGKQQNGTKSLNRCRRSSIEDPQLRILKDP